MKECEMWGSYRCVAEVPCHLACDAVSLDEYRGADKSLAQPGRKQATTTEDFEFHVSYL
jgi:hypothetical protein